jgi:hypothetical protein
MSYWDLPRITVRGTFFTDPSTVDNDPTHYDPAVENPSPWQTPKGHHHFKFTQAAVMSVIDGDGNVVLEGDPLIAAPFTSADQPTPAKIVDLDVYQQAVSRIWALQIQIKLPGGATLTGAMDPPDLNGYNPTRVVPTRGWQEWDSGQDSSYGDDSDASGIFINVVRVPAASWPSDAVSPLLGQLRSRAIQDSQGNYLLSFRFVCDGYKNVFWEPGNLNGRFVGNIGPVLSPHEPPTTAGGRWLAPRAIDPKTSPWYYPPLYNLPCCFADRGNGIRTFVADFAGALSTQYPGGPPVPLGDLTVEWGSNPDRIPPFQVNEATYNYFGGIVEVPVMDEQYASRESPLRIRTTRDDISPDNLLWTEDPSGLAYWALDRGLRMTSEPGGQLSKLDTGVYITQWGEPAAGLQLAVDVIPAEMGMTVVTVNPTNPAKGDTSQAQGALSAAISPSDANGIATVSLEAVKDPGSRTPQLNSQLYFLCVRTTETPPPDLMKVPWPQERMISTVLWASYEINTNPDWETVRDMFVPYAKLYPGMTELINLTDFHAFQIFATNPPWEVPGAPPIFTPCIPFTLPDGKQIQRGAIPFMMTLPQSDPRFMPVSRDLAPNRLLTILYYCYNLQQRVPGITPEIEKWIAKTSGGGSNNSGNK